MIPDLSGFRKWLALALAVFLLAGLSGLAQGQTGSGTTLYLPLVSRGVSAPVLKFERLGCYSSWCETGWYSSPAAVDVNGDGRLDIVASAYSIWAIDGETGAILWKTRSGHDVTEGFDGMSNVGRTWPGIAVADVDRDGTQEIITAHSGGVVSVYTLQGRFKPGWYQKPHTSEWRGLLVADLDGNGSAMEILATRASGSAVNTWVFSSSGQIRANWPQLSNDSGYAWGVYNANAAAGNLTGNSALEVVVPSDVHYINAYDAGGNQLPASATDYPGKGWGKVGVWEDLTVEKRGWGACDGNRSESYRANFADGPAVIADVNGDGVREVVAVGNMYDCSQSPYLSRYYAPFIFNADRSRFRIGAWDWRTNPLDTGAPISEDYNVIESAEPNPVVADLDGDGVREILFASYDGRVHAFWLDKTEHGNWPFEVYQPAEGVLRFASEPVVADLDNNGKAEVLFASWTEKGSNRTGKLHGVSFDGNPLFEVSLPAPFNANWNGALAAPTLANVDSDADLEVVLMTSHSGVVVYDLPGTASARILWGTGRGNFQRTASP
ncbi:VCBS repeat-containing protein [Anaerolinea sp.]|uniref:FG-GAP repeat domain-containing protein n=1 Tax=Anaerolinea sp. TaxID=1872519 RepID=UPI002ACEE8B2|nr:VCBS repeat-containing protein [Anaerolinea sp.]